jgi:hypothetical protein
MHEQSRFVPALQQRDIKRLGGRAGPRENATQIRPPCESLRLCDSTEIHTRNAGREQATKQGCTAADPALVGQAARAAVEHDVALLPISNVHGHAREWTVGHMQLETCGEPCMVNHGRGGHAVDTPDGSQ